MRCTSDRGAHSEMLACAWLIQQGFDVFRNISAAGPVDLIVRDRDTGETISVDVKGLQKPTYNLDGSIRYFARNREDQGQVHFLIVVHNQVAGFFRNTGERNTEPYWPFSRLPVEGGIA